MVSWDKICQPKKSGGLGLRKMEAIKSAFLSKLMWKLFHDHSLWVDQMCAKYPVNENFFGVDPKQSESWAWKCILNNGHLFLKRIRWKVGSGTNINFWLDNCCANDSLASMLGITDFALIDTSLIVSHFITNDHEWDVPKLKGLVSEPFLQLILATPIPYNDITDSICWDLSGNGNFSTKSATWLAHGLNLTNSPS